MKDSNSIGDNLQQITNNINSMYLKYNEKTKNKTIVSRMVPPPDINQPGSFTITQTNQVSDVKQPQRNPIRHYRKQTTGTNSSRLLINPQFDVPGSSIVKNTQDCPSCTDDSPLFFSEEIYPNNEPTKCLQDCTGYQSTDPELWKYTCCSSENNIIKSANTNLSKKYATTNREYLKNKGKSFTSNLYSDITKNSRDCSNCHINNIVNNNFNNVPETGNVNNAIGGTSMSAYIYRRSFRDIAENSISNNNKLCCPEAPGKVLYKNNNNVCKVNDYPNLSRRAILCRRR